MHIRRFGLFCAVGALLGLSSPDPALAVKASPPTAICTGACEKCIEFEHTETGDRCLKCGLDPNCSGTPSDPGLSADLTAILNAHNAYRRQHCAPALTWSAQLAAGAQTWADACTRQHSKEAWSSQACCGENLYWGSGTKGGAEDAVKWWHDEVRKYNFNAPQWSNDVAHFTQVVWKGSKEIGCGVARCGDENYWVCRYAPTGNWNATQQDVLAANVGCAQPAAEAPPQNTASVALDVDVYKAPGKGKPIGVLRKGSQVSLIEPCGSNNWCHVGGAAVPNGEGWVYSGPDYRSLTF